MYNHGAHPDDTAYRQAPRVAQKDLSRKTVKPQITYQCPYKGSHEDYQLFTARYVHHIEIFCPDDTTARVGENQQRNTDYR